MTLPLSIGIDFGGTTIKIAVARGGEIIQRGTILDTQKLGSPEAMFDAISTVVAQLREAHPEVAAIGAGLPGIVDATNGIVLELSNVPGWSAVPLRQILHDRTGLPVAVDNDAKSMTYAEWRFGAARGKVNVICVTLGTGVGGGLILDGKLYRGSANGAGEIGQTSIDFNGRPGVYGNLGAMEKYVGNHQIAERARELYRQAGRERSLEDCSPKALATAAEGNDAVALALWKEIGTEIGAALANIVWLLNPDCIVLGGGVAKAGELLLEPIRAAIRARTMPAFFENLQIVPATLGNDAGIIGAAALGLEAVPATRVVH